MRIFRPENENFNVVLLDKVEEYYPISNVKKMIKQFKAIKNENNDNLPIAVFAGPYLNRSDVEGRIKETGINGIQPFRPFAGERFGALLSRTELNELPRKYFTNQYLDELCKLNVNGIRLIINPGINIPCIWGGRLLEPFDDTKLDNSIDRYRALDYVKQSKSLKELNQKIQDLISWRVIDDDDWKINSMQHYDIDENKSIYTYKVILKLTGKPDLVTLDMRFEEYKVWGKIKGTFKDLVDSNKINKKIVDDVYIENLVGGLKSQMEECTKSILGKDNTKEHATEIVNTILSNTIKSYFNLEFDSVQDKDNITLKAKNRKTGLFFGCVMFGLNPFDHIKPSVLIDDPVVTNNFTLDVDKDFNPFVKPIKTLDYIVVDYIVK